MEIDGHMGAQHSIVRPALEVQDLTKKYGHKEVVAGLNFRVERSSVTCLLGANGAGKTTTLAMIMGLVEPSGGELLFFGERPKKGNRHLKFINFASQYFDIPMRLSTAENLLVWGKLYGTHDLRSRIAELAIEFDLAGFLNRPFATLSAGQRMRVALAKALINRPKLLLLDEPTASLDPAAAEYVRSRLDAYRQKEGASILLASHSMVEVERLCDAVLVMAAGKIVERGSPMELMRRHGCSSMEEVFLRIAGGGIDGARNSTKR